jgi:TRAP-type C4-dicarboxylate transport system permease large subunit
VLHGMAPELSLGTIFRGVVPFLVADAARIALFVLVPQVVTWLPTTLGFVSYR